MTGFKRCSVWLPFNISKHPRESLIGIAPGPASHKRISRSLPGQIKADNSTCEITGDIVSHSVLTPLNSFTLIVVYWSQRQD
jgi:hypothetical protein